MSNDAPEIDYVKVLNPQKWCIECEIVWRGPDPCFICNKEGIPSASRPSKWPVTSTDLLLPS